MATAQDKKILGQFFGRLTREIEKEQAVRGIRASGRSAKSLRFEVDEKGGTLYGEDYFEQQEQGLAPEGEGPNRLRNRYVNLQERIRQWMDYKSSFSSLSSDRKDSISYAISKSIREKGTQTYSNRLLGLPLSDIIAIRVEALRVRLAKSKVTEVRSMIVEAYK